MAPLALSARLQSSTTTAHLRPPLRRLCSHCVFPSFPFYPQPNTPLLACHEQLCNKCRTNPLGFPLAHSARPPLSSIPSTSDGARALVVFHLIASLPAHSRPKRKNTKADAGEVFVALLEAIHASSGDETELRDPARECCVAHKVDLLVRARVLM